MKKTLRLVTLLMAILLCASIFASCGDTSNNTDNTTAAKAQDTTATEKFPEANYNGETFQIYAREASSYTQSGIYAEEQNGDVINDNALTRNQQVEAKYNIKFALKTASNPGNSLEADLRSDLVDYDLILDQRSVLGGLIAKGFLADWNTLDIDMTKSWWDINVKKGYDIDGKCYLAVNDVSTGNLSSARFLYFGKELVTNYKLTSPYEYVENNNWTLDTFIGLVKSVSNPSDDPTQLGVYGMLRETGESNGNHMHFFTGCGIEYVRWEDGKLVNNIDDSAIQKLQDITDKLTQALTTDYTLTYDEVNKFDTVSTLGKYDKARTYFASAHFLFVQNGMGVSSAFKEMTQGFGVVPNPKYNTDQENYIHKVDRYSILWAIPNASSVNTERIAVVADYWAYASKTTVMTAYYDLVIKSRNVDEATAGKNLDIVKNTMYYEIGDLFSTGIASAINGGYTGGNMSSKFSAIGKKAITQSLNNVNSALAELNK